MPRELLVVALSTLLSVSCRALPTNFDQRQDGSLNVKLDLENLLVVLVARPTSKLDDLDATFQLLAESKRTAPPAGRTSVPVEPGTARPEDKVLVVVQAPNKSARSLKELVRRGCMGSGPGRQQLGAAAAGSYKLVEVVDEPQSLRLIGDAIENCGPGRSRDRFGVCQSDGLAMVK